MILLVHSTRDIAGTNIANSILQKLPFKEANQTFQEKPIYQAEINAKKITYITLKDEAVNAQTLPRDFPNEELIIFLSRHSSRSGKPTLSVHTPGNFGKAELGGMPRQVSVSPAKAMSNVLKALNQLKIEKRLDYDVSYECTHHGPSLQVATMFVELGSSEKQWNDLAAAGAVAQAVVEAMAQFQNSNDSAVLGIGGTHYNQKFTQMALDGEAVFGHMIPKHSVSLLDSELISQCIQRTLEKVEYVLLDWKGIRSGDKLRLLGALKEIELETRKV